MPRGPMGRMPVPQAPATPTYDCPGAVKSGIDKHDGRDDNRFLHGSHPGAIERPTRVQRRLYSSPSDRAVAPMSQAKGLGWCFGPEGRICA